MNSTNATMTNLSSIATTPMAIGTTAATSIVSNMTISMSTISSNYSAGGIPNGINNTSSTMGLCDSFAMELPQSVGLSIVFGVCFMLGIFLACFGYRVFRAAYFVQSLALFGALTHILLSETTSLSMVFNGIISGAVGTLFGSVSAIILPVGIVIGSIAQATFAAGGILIVVDLFTFIDYFWIPIGLVVGMFILLVALCFAYQRPVMICYITSFSAILVMLGVDFFMDQFLLANHVYHKLQAKAGSTACWFSYLIFGLWPLLMLVGCSVQFIRTAKGFNHKGDADSPMLTKKKSPSLHRGLYYNGDIIAQAWIQDTEDTLEKRHSYMQPYEDCYPEHGEDTTLV